MQQNNKRMTKQQKYYKLAKVLQNRKRIKKYKKYCKLAKVLQNRITPLHSSATKGLLFVISNTSCLLNLP